MERHRDKIRAQGLRLAAISDDSTGVLKAFAEREHIEFELLSDSDSRIIRSYGILNESVAASILLRQFGVAPIAHEAVAAKHLKLNVSGDDIPARPGQRISLAVEVLLPERVHVYAPGVSGYIPISLNLESSPAFQTEPIAFPPAKLMRLETIHETVPVYERQLRLLETITLGGVQQIEPLLDANHNLTIHGELRYQACDDHESFIPETVRFKWTVHVLPFDRTRVPEPLRRKL